MKRLRLTLLLLLLMMTLTACTPSGNSMEALSVTAAPQEDEIPRADGDDAAETDTSALIWYRYGDEPMLRDCRMSRMRRRCCGCCWKGQAWMRPRCADCSRRVHA